MTDEARSGDDAVPRSAPAPSSEVAPAAQVAPSALPAAESARVAPPAVLPAAESAEVAPPAAPPDPPADAPPSAAGEPRTPIAEPAAVFEAPSAPPAKPARPPARGFDEPPERVIEVPRRRLAAQTRRDFLLFSAGTIAAAIGAWWLLPDGARARLLPGALHDPLDTLAARAGLTAARRERVLGRALTFDDDVAEALYSRDRRVRTYDRSQVTPLRNNYDGRTPGPQYLAGWSLRMSGLASGSAETLRIGDLLSRFPLREQVTRLVCVEGWSAIAWWGGIRFADLLAAYPPAAGARWAALRSSVNLNGAGRSDPYYVSIDLGTAHHAQTLLATHHGGQPLTLEHGAPLRLLAPMKLGLKNIKAITEIEYSVNAPRDYWNERGYSKYDGL